MRRRHTLADHLPWAALLAPGILVTTAGALLTTWRVRGPDADSLTDEVLIARAAQLNHLVQRYGYGWILHWDAIRRPAQRYPASRWPTAVSRLIESERAALFADAGQHFETDVYLSLIFQTPRETTQRAWTALYERRSPAPPVAYQAVLRSFVEEAETLQGLLQGLFVDVERLENDALLTYLHACVHPGSVVHVTPPHVPVFLAHHLADLPLLGGEEAMLGDLHLRLVSVKTWPHACVPGILAGLDTLPLPYRVSLRWRPLDPEQAIRETHRRQRMWLQKRKGLLTMLREEIMKQPSAMLNPEMEARAQEAVACQQAVAEGAIALGDLTLSLLVWDEEEARVTEKAVVVARTLNAQGFTTLRERQHSVDGWLSTMPGTTHDHVRSVLLSSQNLVDLAPVTQAWSGPAQCPHLGTPLAYATTNTSTPFRLSLYQQDVGHSLVLGPNGSGKSTLLSFLAASWLRYPGARVVFLESGQSARCMTAAMGGAWVALGADLDGVCLQPLAHIDEAAECAWASSWVETLLTSQLHRPLQPDERGAIWQALTSLALKPAVERTLTSLHPLLQDPGLRAALMPMTVEGPYGMLLDGDEDPMPATPWWCFELGAVPAAALPAVLPCLMHAVERRLDGSPTLILIDEAWTVLEALEAWMRTMRKRNAALCLATQGVLDIARSPLAHVIQEQCPTRLYLPNSHALEPQTMAAYTAWGLTPQQCRLIATALPKKEYYVQSPSGSRLIDFELGPIVQAFAGRSRPQDLATLATMPPGDAFGPAWLRHNHLAWAADALEQEIARCADTDEPYSS